MITLELPDGTKRPTPIADIDSIRIARGGTNLPELVRLGVIVTYTDGTRDAVVGSFVELCTAIAAAAPKARTPADVLTDPQPGIARRLSVDVRGDFHLADAPQSGGRVLPGRTSPQARGPGNPLRRPRSADQIGRAVVPRRQPGTPVHRQGSRPLATAHLERGPTMKKSDALKHPRRHDPSGWFRLDEVKTWGSPALAWEDGPDGPPNHPLHRQDLRESSESPMRRTRKTKRRPAPPPAA